MHLSVYFRKSISPNRWLEPALPAGPTAIDKVMRKNTAQTMDEEVTMAMNDPKRWKKTNWARRRGTAATKVVNAPLTTDTPISVSAICAFLKEPGAAHSL